MVLITLKMTVKICSYKIYKIKTIIIDVMLFLYFFEEGIILSVNIWLCIGGSKNITSYHTDKQKGYKNTNMIILFIYSTDIFVTFEAGTCHHK